MYIYAKILYLYRPDNNNFDSPYKIFQKQAVRMTAFHKYLSASQNLAGPDWSMDRPSILLSAKNNIGNLLSTLAIDAKNRLPFQGPG